MQPAKDRYLQKLIRHFAKTISFLFVDFISSVAASRLNLALFIVLIVLALMVRFDQTTKSFASFQQFYAESAVRLRGNEYYSIPEHFDPSLSGDLIMTRDFPDATSVLDAFVISPRNVLMHVKFNIEDSLRSIRQGLSPFFLGQFVRHYLAIMFLVLFLSVDSRTNVVNRDRLTVALAFAMVSVPVLLLRAKLEYVIVLLPLLVEILIISAKVLKKGMERAGLMRDRGLWLRRTSFAALGISALVLAGYISSDRAANQGHNSETDNQVISNLIRRNCDGCVLIAMTATSYSAMAHPAESEPINIGAAKEYELQEIAKMSADRRVIIIKDRADQWLSRPYHVDLVDSIIDLNQCRDVDVPPISISICSLG